MESNQSTNKNEPDQVGFLTDEAKKFLAVAVLFLMDLDIQSKVNSEAKVSLRNEYADSIRAFAIPIQYQKVVTEYCSYEHELLYLLGGAVKDIGDIITIGTELVLLNPWVAAQGIYEKDIDDEVRRIALKEIASATSVPTPTAWVDAMMGVYLDRAMGKLKSVERNPKKWIYVAAGAAIGGFVFAPHVGAAIGASMGLYGAAGTSAGLAVLGGGSLASGGLGMLGGTYLVAAASSVVGFGGGALVNAVSASKMSTKHEAIKLCITVESMRRFEREDLVDCIRVALRRRVEDLAGQKFDVSSKIPVDKVRIKVIEKEEELLLAIVPSVTVANPSVAGATFNEESE
jgi:hypothetical protein